MQLCTERPWDYAEVRGANLRTSHAQVAVARQLSLEWQAYVVRSHALRKVFVSVKGFYFQVSLPRPPVDL